MHTHDIAHLDIKIDNVLLDIVEKDDHHYDLCIKLADFGMS